MMRGPTVGLVVLLIATIALGGVPSASSAAQEEAAGGVLGLSIEEWESMTSNARRAHLRSLPRETRQALLASLRTSSKRSVPPGRTIKKTLERSPRPAAKNYPLSRAQASNRMRQLIWDPSKLGSGGSQEGVGSGLTPPGIVRYDTNNALAFFATGDHKGNRFDTKNGVPIPTSARFDKIGVLLAPAPPPMTTFLPFQDPIVNVKILGPAGTDLGGGNVLARSGENILTVTPPLHFNGQSLHVAVQDLPGTTYTYSFGISGAVYFYGTFRFAYYRYYNSVLTYSFHTTQYFSTSYDLPFYATTLFGGAVQFPISSFTNLFGTVVYQYFPIQRLVPIADSMSVNGQGFHGENVKSGGTITPISGRNFGVWIIPLEVDIFSYDHELGNFGPWSSHQP